MHPGTTDASAALLTQFLAWVDRRTRTYNETMDAWRTSCPRISVWEDASLDGLVALTEGTSGAQGSVKVTLTQAGMDRLAAWRAAEADQGRPTC